MVENCEVAFKPSAHLMGHRQTVQKQMSRCRMRFLIRLYSVCLQNVLLKVGMKLLHNNPEIQNGFILIQLIKMGNSGIRNQFLGGGIFIQHQVQGR